MEFSRSGRFYRAVRITGPGHNLLGLDLVEAPGEVAVIDLAPASSPPGLSAAEVSREVKEGVEAANRELGTAFHVAAIEFLSSDTPPLRVYAGLAWRIVERLAKREPFADGTGARENP